MYTSHIRVVCCRCFHANLFYNQEDRTINQQYTKSVGQMTPTTQKQRYELLCKVIYLSRQHISKAKKQ
jgi:isocitrate lyase